MRRPASKNHQLQCRERLHLLSASVWLRLWCPLRLQPGVRCLWPARRSIIRFLLRCWHALRLQCAATERDGLRVGTTVIELAAAHGRTSRPGELFPNPLNSGTDRTGAAAVTK